MDLCLTFYFMLSFVPLFLSFLAFGLFYLNDATFLSSQWEVLLSLFFKITHLWRYKSHSTQFRVYFSGFFMYSEVQPSAQSIVDHCHHPERNPLPLGSYFLFCLHCPPHPPLQTTSHLSPCGCNVYNVTFCVWLLSFIMCSRAICV